MWIIHASSIECVYQYKCLYEVNFANLGYHSGFSYRVAVVRAAPRRSSATVRIESVDQTDDRAVSSRDHQESTGHDNEDTPGNHRSPGGGAAVVTVPVVVQPHNTSWLEAEKCSEKRTDKGYEATEGRDTAGNAVGDNRGDCCTA